MAKLIMPRGRMGGNLAQAMTTSYEVEPPLPTIATHEHSERVLLLEDEQQTNLVLKEYLQSLGYNVVAVDNGVEGLKEVMKSDFELVICDMMMPRLPGDMFYLAVQKTRPNLCKRFVFITGHQETPTVGSFIAKSEAVVLVKPFRLHQLEVTLEGILSKFPHRPRPSAQPLRIVRMPEDPSLHLEESNGHSPHNGKKEAVPSMVVKALKIVGFLRGGNGEMPPPLGSTETPAPQVTRRISKSTGQTTRVIKMDADRPKVTRRLTPPPLPASPAKSETTERPQITRRIAAAQGQTLRVPQTTVKIPRTTVKIAPPKAKITLKVANGKPAVTKTIKKAAAPAKVTGKTAGAKSKKTIAVKKK